MMVISILPHKAEAALADSSIQHIGFFEPTGFSRWWFSYIKVRQFMTMKVAVYCGPGDIRIEEVK
jgi:hypothetical protein